MSDTETQMLDSFNDVVVIYYENKKNDTIYFRLLGVSISMSQELGSDGERIVIKKDGYMKVFIVAYNNYIHEAVQTIKNSIPQFIKSVEKIKQMK